MPLILFNRRHYDIDGGTTGIGTENYWSPSNVGMSQPFTLGPTKIYITREIPEDTAWYNWSPSNIGNSTTTSVTDNETKIYITREIPEDTAWYNWSQSNIGY